MEYKNVWELYEENKTDSPESILLKIKDFFVSLGENYQRGLMSDEEFYVATYYGSVYVALWRMKNDIKVDRIFLTEHEDFKNSWVKWKKTGRLSRSDWMYNCISQSGNLLESVAWIFKVMDVLKIPCEEFVPVLSDPNAVLPDTI